MSRISWGWLVLFALLCAVVLLALFFACLFLFSGEHVLMWAAPMVETWRGPSMTTNCQTRLIELSNQVALIEYLPNQYRPHAPALLLLQGATAPAWNDRYQCSIKALDRCHRLCQMGYRIFLLAHSCATWNSTLKSRAYDLDQAIEWLTQRCISIVILGHSFGALVAALWLSRYDHVHRSSVLGLACLNPALSLRDAIARMTPIRISTFPQWVASTMTEQDVCLRTMLVEIYQRCPSFPLVVTYVKNDNTTDYEQWHTWLNDSFCCPPSVRAVELSNRNRLPSPHSDTPFLECDRWLFGFDLKS